MTITNTTDDSDRLIDLSSRALIKGRGCLQMLVNSGYSSGFCTLMNDGLHTNRLTTSLLSWKKLVTLGLTLFCLLPVKANDSLQALVGELPSNTAIQVFAHETSENSVSIIGKEELVSHQWMTNQAGKMQDFVRINVKKAGDKAWNVMAKSNANNKPIVKGDWVYASYYVRASGDTDITNIRGFIERSVPNWMLVSDASIAATHQWTQVVAVGKAPENFAKNSVFVSLHLAAKQQSIDIAEMTFLSLPSAVNSEVFPVTPLQYVGMEKDASWRNKAEQMIKQHREAEFKVFVLDKWGQPVSNAKVNIDLQDVDYQLGSMANSLIVKDSELGEQYRQWFGQFFNYATATIYWADWAWENPKVRDSYLKKMAYFNDANIKMRGHVLLYPGFRFSPKVLIDLQHDKAAFIERVNQQIDEMVPLLKAFGLHEYDVINELRAEKEWLDIVGMDTVVQWYKRVHALHPDAILYINENSILTDGGNNSEKDHYYNLITNLLKKGAPIHGIGMQGHFNGIVTPVEKMWAILDRFSAFNLPIRITEYDTDTRDTNGQAMFDTDFYQAMYAHPATVGITRWGFYQPVMWRPSGALIDSENNLKPNALAYLDWLKVLRNNQQKLESNKHGAIVFEGKYGKYSVKVNGQDFSCNFIQPPFAYELNQSKQSCTVRLNR